MPKTPNKLIDHPLPRVPMGRKADRLPSGWAWELDQIQTSTPMHSASKLRATQAKPWAYPKARGEVPTVWIQGSCSKPLSPQPLQAVRQGYKMCLY